MSTTGPRTEAADGRDRTARAGAAEAIGHPLRVVIVDGQGLFARCLELALPKASGGRLNVIATAGDVEDALAIIADMAPDVALINVELADPGALALIEKVVGSHPDVRLIGLTNGGDDLDQDAAALRLGLEALVTKSERPEQLLGPVLGVLQGWRILSARVLDDLLTRARRPGSEVLEGLDAVTVQLWLLVAEGLELAQIAERVNVSERTAKRMVADLRRQLGARNRIEMAALAGRVGLLDHDRGGILPTTVIRDGLPGG